MQAAAYRSPINNRSRKFANSAATVQRNIVVDRNDSYLLHPALTGAVWVIEHRLRKTSDRIQISIDAVANTTRVRISFRALRIVTAITIGVHIRSATARATIGKSETGGCVPITTIVSQAASMYRWMRANNKNNAFQISLMSEGGGHRQRRTSRSFLL
jgi:hypothetical protein